MKTSDDYELIAYEFGAQMARQNIRYAEVTFSPSTHQYSLGIPFDVFFSGLTKGRLRAQKDFGVEIRWVFDIVRDIPELLLNHRRAEYTLAVAEEGMHDGVVALGLCGGEVGNPPERYAEWFEKALERGLHSVPHAGETVGPESVWGAIRVLHAERLGYGVRSIEILNLLIISPNDKSPSKYVRQVILDWECILILQCILYIDFMMQVSLLQ